MLIPEEKLLIGVFSEQVFSGDFLRQARPFCCSGVIDLYSVPMVRFIDIFIEGREFTLIEPMCPVCGKWVKAYYSIIS